jgi:hypothetical protein
LNQIDGRKAQGQRTGCMYHSMLLLGVANISSSANCARAESRLKSKARNGSIAAVRSRSFPANNLPDFTFEQTIILVLLKHRQMQFADDRRTG